MVMSMAPKRLFLAAIFGANGGFKQAFKPTPGKDAALSLPFTGGEVLGHGR
jgi:hypothetical protein